MKFFPRSKALRTLIISAVLLSPLLLGHSVAAKDPDPNANPVLANIIRLGGTQVYYLGVRDGLDGWLIVKSSQVQIAYDIPGSQVMIMGALFGPSGENITSVQVQSILDAHPELKNMLLAQAQQQANAISSANMANVNNSVANIAAQVQAQAMAANNAPAAAMQQAAAMLAQQQAAAAGTAPVATGSVGAPAAAQSPGEKLVTALHNASGVNLGNPNAPLIMMIMDPTCPHCQKTWGMLRDRVLANNLQVRLIPIARDPTNPDDDNYAAQLLHVANPLDAWNKYIGGDKSALAGTPDPISLAGLHSNQTLIESWHIKDTPFLVYRGHDGKVKIVEGEPKDPTVMLADVAP